MALFHGSKNLHLGFDAKAAKPEVSAEYDADRRHYVIRLVDAAEKKWREAVESHGFHEVAEPKPAASAKS